jgi:FtsZ-binding cell division protein ZapB
VAKSLHKLAKLLNKGGKIASQLAKSHHNWQNRITIGKIASPLDKTLHNWQNRLTAGKI